MPAKEMSIGELLSSGFEAFKKNLKTTVLFFVGAQAVIFLLTYLLHAPFLNILMLPVVIFMQIALLKSYKHPYGKIDTNEILSLKDPHLKDKIWKLVLTYLIYVVLIVILFLLLIVPGIIFMVYWYLFAYVVLDQGLSGMAALKKSKEYINGHWWKTFALFVIAAILSGVISSIVSGISSTDALVGGFLMAVTSGLISVYFGYVAVAYYFDLKK
jgi:hypothetical protein